MTTTNTTTTERTRVRASSLHSYALCPGRLQLEQDPECPQEEESAAAESGTAIHAELAGEPERELAQDEEITRERCEEQLQMILAKFGEPLEQHREIELALELKDATITGHPDVILVYADFVVVPDYKTGRGRSTPEVTRNMQLAIYGMMAALRFRKSKAVVAIIEPARSREPMYCEYDKEALKARWHEATEILRAAKALDAPRVPGPSQCQYCRARTLCPEYRRQVEVVAETDQHLGRWRDLTPADRLAFFDRMRVAEKAIATFKRWFHAELSENPDAYAGQLRLKAGRKVRKVTDSEGLWEHLHKSIALEPEAFARCVTVGLTALQEEVRKKTGLKGAALKADFDSGVEPFCEVKEQGAGFLREGIETAD